MEHESIERTKFSTRSRDLNLVDLEACLLYLAKFSTGFPDFIKDTFIMVLRTKFSTCRIPRYPDTEYHFFSRCLTPSRFQSLLGSRSY